MLVASVTVIFLKKTPKGTVEAEKEETQIQSVYGPCWACWISG